MQIDRTSLTAQLEAFRAAFVGRLPACERDRLAPAEAALRTKLLYCRGPREGDFAPDFNLPDQHGTRVRLRDRLDHGPVILLFIRGAWCPFCTITLRAYQNALHAIHDAGGDLLAITPQPASTCCQMAERDLLAFQTLSDPGSRVAHDYGVAFALDPALRPMYQRLGHDLPHINATADWIVPLPATFVIGTDGRIARAHVDAAAHNRLEPVEAFATLATLAEHAHVG